MGQRWAVVLVLAILSAPSAAEACTCGSFFEPTPAACATATRVFAGSVAGYRWPTSLDAVLRTARVDVELTVDRVWKGQVPPVLTTTTGLGGGDCGISPPPGTRFVFCDSEADDAAPSFGFCDGGAFVDPEHEAAFGPGRPPIAGLSVVKPRPLWRRPGMVFTLGLGAAVLLAALSRRRRLALAVVCATVVLTLGDVGAGAESGAVRCSVERAQAILSSAAEGAGTYHACTDWGLATFEVYEGCLGFPDGDGGRWWTCRTETGFATLLNWDRPR